MPTATPELLAEQGEPGSQCVGQRTSRTETLDAACACGLLIQVTYLLCSTCLGFFLNLF